VLKVEKAEWVNLRFVNDPKHLYLVSELAGYHCWCVASFRLFFDEHTGEIKEQTPNSALHWSRVYEWPWVILNGELSKSISVLDVGAGHAVLQYAVAARSGWVYSLDPNEDSQRAVSAMVARLRIQNLTLVHGSVGTVDKIYGTDNLFDRVVCVSVLEHTPDWEQEIHRLALLTRPGGLIMLTMDVNENPPTRGEFGITEKDVRRFFEDENIPPKDHGFRHLMPDGSVLSCLCLKLRKG